MKSFITPKYVFTPGNAGVGTLDLSLITNFDIKRLVAVININSNAIIYNVANSAAGFTMVSNGVITLDYNTSAMSSSDLLQIIYDNDDSISNNELIEAIEAMRMAIQSLNRTVGLAQVNPLTGSMFVDGSRVNQPVTGNLSTINQVSLLLNTQAISGQITVPISMERCAADNLRRNIITT